MADPFKNRAQLKAEVGDLLALTEPGEALSSEDDSKIDGKIDPLLALLSADEIVDISNPEEIELKYFEPVARLLANICGPSFGSPINEDAKATDEATLRRITATKPTYERLRVVYF